MFYKALPIISLGMMTLIACGKEDDSPQDNPSEPQGGWLEPSDLVRDFNSIESGIKTEFDRYCQLCTEGASEECTDEFYPKTFEDDDAACIFIESTSEELAGLESYFACLNSASAEAVMCMSAITACGDEAWNSCLQGFDSQAEVCDMMKDQAYEQKIEEKCFGVLPPYVCDDGEAIEGDYVCDGDNDCAAGEDESDCGGEAP